MKDVISEKYFQNVFTFDLALLLCPVLRFFFSLKIVSQILTLTHRYLLKEWTTVVHFDQQTGTPHAFCWSKSYILNNSHRY